MDGEELETSTRVSVKASETKEKRRFRDAREEKRSIQLDSLLDAEDRISHQDRVSRKCNTKRRDAIDPRIIREKK